MANTMWNGTEVSHHLPPAAAGAAAAIIVYTIICLFAGLIFVFHVLHHESRFLYVSLFAYGSTLICIIALIQETNYLANWYGLTVYTWKSAKISAISPELSFGPQGFGLQGVLFWIMTYLLNACALIVSFWAMNLCSKTWQWKFGPLREHREHVSTVAKVIAVAVPAIYVVVRANTTLKSSMSGLIVFNYFIFFFSFVMTTISVLLIVFKYAIKLVTKQKRISKLSTSGSQTVASPNSALIDQHMLRRFMIAAVVVCAYNMYLIFYSTSSYVKILEAALSDMPDFSARTTIINMVDFIPLTTLALLGFLLFGTTSQAIDHYSAAWTSLTSRMPWRLRSATAGDSIYGVSTTGTSVVELEKGARPSILP